MIMHSDDTTTTQLGRLLFKVTGNTVSGYTVVGDAATEVSNAEKSHRAGSRRWVED
ncbi:hypothetical protein TSUD_56430 [Trifolium subterraneum]|uniref:Uncharacterized protein n=1 Tax=Trifolium subterraneum TaxID=3900 RepID=A0A2Z6NIS9_TRISU|nr:hypothetical protein TSUD_56430 [Trifolium subterraneum]